MGAKIYFIMLQGSKKTLLSLIVGEASKKHEKGFIL